ncbi:hypothetical protein WN944_024343 [Citrus x changshan-huyou]|uniref:Uncharacterized protein n=1 Tax=Citrus x changshan-huyou TaxID=2935761 RepID=A0AAP0QB65_9ROSI
MWRSKEDLLSLWHSGMVDVSQPDGSKGRFFRGTKKKKDLAKEMRRLAIELEVREFYVYVDFRPCVCSPLAAAPSPKAKTPFYNL